jgi:murein DD-endopeptidase MepM/ murein hydrolase activator NlpD
MRALVALVLSLLTVSCHADFRFPIMEDDYKMLTSPTGWRISPTLRVAAYHDGIDIQTVPKAQIVAAADGWVDQLWPPPDGWFRGHPLYGGLIILRHADGFYTLYAHLSAVYVVGWQAVRAGQVIGRVGSTGQSLGEHLHFAIYNGTTVLNPLLYVSLPGGYVGDTRRTEVSFSELLK